MTKGIDELFDLPSTWEWASLGQLTWSVADGPHFSPKYVEKGKGMPFISGRNISYEGIDFSDAKYVSPKDHEEFSKRAHPLTGDVLLTKGGTTGIATVVTQSDEFSIWVHVALLKVVKELVTPFYLRDVLSAPFVYVQSQAQTHGVGNQDLGLTRMVHMALPLPPLAEQQEIVRRVQALFALADHVEAQLPDPEQRVEKLITSILDRAFRGGLVPTEAELARQEGRDYEPASALLERIRTRAGRKDESDKRDTGVGNLRTASKPRRLNSVRSKD
jgi:type I restriction enzyme S subunit